MRFSLDLGKAGHFSFDTLPDMANALQIANVFKPFENNVEYKIIAIEGDDSVDLIMSGLQFSGTNEISFGLSDDARRAYDKFEMEHRTLV